MARRTRRSARRYFSKAKRSYRKKSMLGHGLVGDVVAGAVVGGVVALGTPTISSYVPKIGPLSPVTVAVGGAGLAGKMLHKGGNFTTAAVMLGTAMAVHDVMSSTGMTGGAVSVSGAPPFG